MIAVARALCGVTEAVCCAETCSGPVIHFCRDRW